MERRVTWRNSPAIKGQELNYEVIHEGSFVGQEDLFQVQDCAPCWRGEGDLRKPEAQAAARMSWKFKTRNSKFENRKSCAYGSESASLEFRFSNFEVRFSNFEVKHGTHCWC
jgi:hypothetical protein